MQKFSAIPSKVEANTIPQTTYTNICKYSLLMNCGQLWLQLLQKLLVLASFRWVSCNQLTETTAYRTPEMQVKNKLLQILDIILTLLSDMKFTSTEVRNG